MCCLKTEVPTSALCSQAGSGWIPSLQSTCTWTRDSTVTRGAALSLLQVSAHPPRCHLPPFQFLGDMFQSACIDYEGYKITVFPFHFLFYFLINFKINAMVCFCTYLSHQSDYLIFLCCGVGVLIHDQNNLHSLHRNFKHRKIVIYKR